MVLYRRPQTEITDDPGHEFRHFLVREVSAVVEPDHFRALQPSGDAIRLPRVDRPIAATTDEEQASLESGQLAIQELEVPGSHHLEHRGKMFFAAEQRLV